MQAMFLLDYSRCNIFDLERHHAGHALVCLQHMDKSFDGLSWKSITTDIELKIMSTRFECCNNISVARRGDLTNSYLRYKRDSVPFGFDTRFTESLISQVRIRPVLVFVGSPKQFGRGCRQCVGAIT